MLLNRVHPSLNRTVQSDLSIRPVHRSLAGGNVLVLLVLLLEVVGDVVVVRVGVEREGRGGRRVLGFGGGEVGRGGVEVRRRVDERGFGGVGRVRGGRETDGEFGGEALGGVGLGEGDGVAEARVIRGRGGSVGVDVRLASVGVERARVDVLRARGEDESGGGGRVGVGELTLGNLRQLPPSRRQDASEVVGRAYSVTLHPGSGACRVEMREAKRARQPNKTHSGPRTAPTRLSYEGTGQIGRFTAVQIPLR